MNQTRSLRWGLLGTARINRKLIPHLQSSQRSRLVAVASRDLAKAQAYAHQWQIPECFGSYHELLASSSIDIVYISLPNHLHTEWILNAVRHGKHVLCEKPLALCARDVATIQKEAARFGVQVFEGFMYRHHQQVSVMQALLRSGRVGRLVSIKTSFHFVLDAAEDIRLDPACGGGSLWDIGCYGVNLARTLASSALDHENIAPLEVFGRKLLGPSGVDRRFHGLLQFPDAVQATIECSFDAPAVHILEVVGTKAILRQARPFKPQAKETLSILDEDSEERVEIADARDTFLSQLLNIEDVILEKKSPLVTLDDSFANAATIEALHLSARENRPVSL